MPVIQQSEGVALISKRSQLKISGDTRHTLSNTSH